ncbi:MAG: DUF3667 domain-containing protein [Gammaproteobacteria bacterium]|jgi:hypothetical protein|nr:DUF3667 domain-containing protein [Gammaproteobacteria bacterium]
MSQDYCENCGVTLQGDFCHVCGQTKQSSSRFFGSILMDLLDNLFSYDSRVYKTLVPLMLRPGYVCSEYLSGKRASFLPPFRLYLFASIVFFLLIPLMDDTSVSMDFNEDGTSTTEEADEEIAGYLKLNRNDDSDKVIGIRKESVEADADFPYFIEERKILEDKFNKITSRDFDAIFATALNALPTVMFFLLPILALVLKALYLFSKRYYMEHLIVVLYSQSFLFFMLLFSVALESVHEKFIEKFPLSVMLQMLSGTIVNLCYLWIPVYIFFFMKKVYAQSSIMTLAKFSAISFVYISLIGVAIGIALVWSVIKL